jgi:hypothetical protein
LRRAVDPAGGGTVRDFEKLGEFYLGRSYDLANRTPGDGVILYDSRDLVTHAAIIGMTGSGKTGLALGLLEEAAIDGVPAIAIDPKGDLANLLLTFPDLSPASFRPWINADEARRQGLSEDDFAAREAETWKKGLAAWGQDGARIQKLKDAVDVAVYTPGSNAGLPISIMKSFDAPPAEIVDDHELFAERVSTSVTGLLTLAGITADPVKSREHILLSTIVSDAWRKGEALDLAALISRVQSPPVQRIGVLELDAFYPADDRFQLAMAINGLLASPSFQAWLQGDPLDVGQLLYTPQGKPRLSIVSIAHLNDAERMFFVSMLFGQTLSWMRRQPGTTSLRAILYMDEVAGYIPPVAIPPSKPPLMTLLKQARAFGLGVVLATQNPMDLDYKAMSNIGTWFLGRLQTERDKLRVLDGLEGAIAGSGRFDRAEMDRTLSALGKRVFLLHNVHESHPEVFETRWALSYLAGPLTRDQIRTLMAPRKAAAAPGAPAAAGVAAGTAAAPAPASSPRAAPSGDTRPVLPPDVPQFFAPARTTGAFTYAPRLFCAGSVSFEDAKLGLRETRALTVLASVTDSAVPVDWQLVQATDLALGDLDQQPDQGGAFSPLPSPAAKAKSYAAWEKEFARWIFASQTLDLFKDGDTKLVSNPGEGEREFRIRLQQATREARDAQKQKLEQKYAPKLAMLTERHRKAQQAAERESQQASESKVQAGFSILATGIGALFGRKAISATNISKAASAARSVSRTMKESGDVGRAQDTVRSVQSQIEELDAQLQADLAAVEAASDASQKPLDAVSIKPKKTNITVQRVVLAWVPSEQ